MRPRSLRSLLVIGLALGGMSALRAFAVPAAAAGPPATVTVRPGDTLWALSARFAPAEDPRRWIFAVEQMNHLRHAAIEPGESLRLPARGR